MLSNTGDNGARLAAIIPTLMSRLGVDDVLGEATRVKPSLTGAIVVVVDGMGWHNLHSRSGHARTLVRMDSIKAQTVSPSTTAAALTTITTGKLPGQHGLLGFRILHPKFGVLNSLTEWDQISDPRDWQLSPTTFELAHVAGLESFVIGRSAHANSGLTGAILTGAKYLGVDILEHRFSEATKTLRQNPGALVYVYVDELDRAGHKHGCNSFQWINELERIDASVAELLKDLSPGAGLVITADHGMVDIEESDNFSIEDIEPLRNKIAHIAGEPRFRHIYLKDSAEAVELQRELESFAKLFKTFTKDQCIENALFGEVSDLTSGRIGDLVLIPKSSTALATASDPIFSFPMVGQHGGLTSTEVDIPILFGGALNSAFFV